VRCRPIVAVALIALATAPSAASAAQLVRNTTTAGSTTAGTALSRDAVGPVADPLAANGFTSPSCTTASLFAQISPTARQDCEVSGVAVAPVPLSNYAFDTNISSGLDASFSDDADSIVQTIVLTPVWTAIVWLVHVAVIALEWCYSIDLLAPSLLGAVTSALGNAEQIFTEPWLGCALTVAGIAFAWNGLVRRQIADTVGQAMLMLAMMGAGLWVIADPAGTIGWLSSVADQAALGTVAVSATGNPSQPVASLDDALGEVFDSAITGPWCYLEFGNVDWCRDQSALDPRLEATGEQLERLYSAGATCRGPAPGLVECAANGSAEQRAYAATAIALSAARTNGALFLALPASGLTRDALASQTSLPTLYGTLCGSTGPTTCSAGTAPQAEFRTAQGTWPRAGGLLLIAIGSAGMLAMLGFVAFRLFGAALAVLVYLLLAPLAVLAPAFGEDGRATFRQWLTRLVGAALAKLVYSVLLGVTLLVTRLLTSINTLGWWTQWLLLSVFWWLAFEHRHRMLGFVMHERGEPASRLPLASRIRYGAQLFGSARRAGGRAGRAGAVTVRGAADIWQQARSFPGEPAASVPRGPIVRPRSAARASLSAQVDQSLASDRATIAGGATPGDFSRLRGRRQRLAEEETLARRTGDSRRATSLALRGAALDAQLASRARDASVASHASGGWAASRMARRSRASLLNREARAGDARIQRTGRDYGSLAGLAGQTAAGYARASDVDRRRMRLEVERQLAQRRSWLGVAGIASSRPPGALREPLGESGRPDDRTSLRQRQFRTRLR